MPVKRTFGWIQNPGNLKKLKKVVSIFQAGSSTHKWLTTDRLPLLSRYNLISSADYNAFQNELSKPDIEISYMTLKGKGAGSSGRRHALCSGIVQAIIDAQSSRTYTDTGGKSITMKKPYTDDWSADGYLRWAISCGLLEYSNGTDTCKISRFGQKLALSEDDSQAEREALTEALLSYPPVIRILSLLKEKGEQTKFGLGSQLGFIGELGFTSVPQEIFLHDYCTAAADEQSEIRSNFEGDSDKYARGIASWLTQMGWVASSRKEISGTLKGKSYSAELQVYSITRAGERALIKAHGNSSNPRLPRVVMFEMLASNKSPNAEYLRFQRAHLLKALAGSWKTLEQLQVTLKKESLFLSENSISDHIAGLIAIGLNIVERYGTYKLLDKLTRLAIPTQSAYSNDSVSEIKELVRSKLKAVNHKYLVLIDLAYSDASSKSRKSVDAREFEIQTAELLTKELDFTGMRLGDASRPDVIISYGERGTIIDTKSYRDGFNIDRHSADEMGRYVLENRKRLPGVPTNEWWRNFEADVSKFTFLFVTSFLKGRFAAQLDYISRTHENICGAAIDVANLLYLAEALKTSKLTYLDFFHLFDNQEIRITLP
ncbi:MAG: hypothetical protein IJG33_08285 [Selenomonadaceae bacterium]|nr:hypothetical protein [Selenomonadaceae bacterium]